MKVRTTMTELREKAIDIKGKQYVLVSDRVLYFNETYPNGCIVTERLSNENMEIFKATVTPDCNKPERKFTWYSQAKWWEWFINKTAAMENAETSAVGRWLAMMWIWVIDSIASADEIKKAEGSNTWVSSWATSKESSKDNSQVNKAEDEKPRFNKENLDKFTTIAKQYKNADEALKEIRSYYKVSKDNEWKIRRLYEDLELINS